MFLAVTASICARTSLPIPSWGLHSGGGKRVCQPRTPVWEGSLLGRGGEGRVQKIPSLPRGLESSLLRVPPRGGGWRVSVQKRSPPLQGRPVGATPAPGGAASVCLVRAVRTRRGRCLAAPLTPLDPSGTGVSRLSREPAPSTFPAGRDHSAEPSSQV